MTTGNQDAAAILTALKDELAAMAAAERKGNENSNGPTVSMVRRAALYEGFAARLAEAIRQIAGGPADAAPDSAAAKPALQIGDPAPAGDDVHAGFIYAGIPPGGGEPLWVSK